MLEESLFWLGTIGLVSGIMVGITLLEQGGDSFVRNVMFSIGIACVMFIYLTQLGDKIPWSSLLLLISFLIGGLAATLVALASHANLAAAFVAGALAALTLQGMAHILPPGSFGFTGLHDIPVAIDFLTALGVGAGSYFLLRNWGKDRQPWDS